MRLQAPNPFATRYTAPGAIEFLFEDGRTAAELAERLRVSGWRGQIIGPHGSGKSTLLVALRPLLESAGRKVIEVSLHDGQRNLPAAFWRHCVSADTLFVIDGYEQLGLLARLRLKLRRRRHGCGLLVTTHASVGLPELYRTPATPELARRVVEQLTTLQGGRIAEQDVASRFAAQQGNVREMLFDLYDLYEQRRHGG